MQAIHAYHECMKYLQRLILSIALAAGGLALCTTHTAKASSPTFTYDATDNRYFLLVNSSVDWNDANRYAKSLNYKGEWGYLATPTTSTANAVLYSVSQGTSPWIGAVATSYPSGTLSVNGIDQVQRQWRWSDGPDAGTVFTECRDIGGSGLGGCSRISTPAYSNWDGYQPDNYRGVQDRGIAWAGGTWDDELGTELRPFVVEFGGTPNCVDGSIGFVDNAECSSGSSAVVSGARSFSDWTTWTSTNSNGLNLGGTVATNGPVTTITGRPATGISSPTLYDFTYGGTLAYSSNLQGQDWLAVQFSSVPNLTGGSSASQNALAFVLDGWGNSDTLGYFTGQRCRADQWPPGKMVLWGSDDGCQPSISTRISGLGMHDVLLKFDPVGANNPLVEVIVDGNSLGASPLPSSWKR